VASPAIRLVSNRTGSRTENLERSSTRPPITAPLRRRRIPYDAPYPVPYGSPYGNPYPPTYANQPATNGMAIGSLVSSLVGIPAYFMCLPFVGSIIGVILGIVALSQISSRHQKGREMAIAGIAIGGGCLIGALILLLLYSSVFFWY
jgi:hypothetical protein